MSIVQVEIFEQEIPKSTAPNPAHKSLLRPSKHETFWAAIAAVVLTLTVILVALLIATL